jgi:hypothetical protein
MGYPLEKLFGRCFLIRVSTGPIHKILNNLGKSNPQYRDPSHTTLITMHYLGFHWISNVQMFKAEPMILVSCSSEPCNIGGIKFVSIPHSPNFCLGDSYRGWARFGTFYDLCQ